jgi:hypothetical protein
VLVCSERRVLLAGCWWLVRSKRKVLLAGKPSEQGAKGQQRTKSYLQDKLKIKLAPEHGPQKL